MNYIIGNCQCGSNHITFSSIPIARFICHCLVCQQYTAQAYSDVSVFTSSQIVDMDIRSTTFKRYKLPPNIERGLCKQCHQPSIEFALLGRFVIIATKRLRAEHTLPDPQMHIFYHRRILDINDALPKHSGFLKSQIQVSKLLFKGFLLNKH